MDIPLYIPFQTFKLQMPAPGIETALLAFFVLLGILTLTYSLPDRKPGRIIAMLFHIMGGLISLMAPDMITLLLGWELMTFSAFFIVVWRRRGPDLRSGLRYIVTHMVSAILFFIGAVVHWRTSGSIALGPAVPASQLFFLAAILIKTAMIPLHFWLVDAYPRASFSGSVLLSVYTTKVGVFTAARILRVDLLGQPVLAYIGAVVALVAVIAALRQSCARKLLVYHIVSQLGYMLAGVGFVVGMADITPGITAGLFHAINNIVYKSLLLMVAGVVCRQFGHEDLSRMGGAARKMPVTFITALIAAAAITGVPPLAGYAGKELLKQAVDSPLITVLLALASVGTGLSFIKFIYLIFLRPPKENIPELRDPSPACCIPMLILALLCLINGLCPGLIISGLPPVSYAPGSLIFGFIPPLAAVLLWLGLSGRLTAKSKTGYAVTCRRRTIFRRNRRELSRRLRIWHCIHPQTAYMLIFVFWISIALWWIM